MREFVSLLSFWSEFLFIYNLVLLYSHLVYERRAETGRMGKAEGVVYLQWLLFKIIAFSPEDPL